MLSEEVIDRVVERVVNRIEQANTYVLEKIGKNIKRIGTLNRSSMYQLEQILRFGGDYDKIAHKLAEIMELNVKDIYDIFEEVAKRDYEFTKRFYDYREVKYIPYDQNILLQNEVEAIARATANTYLNLSNTFGFTKLVNGRAVFTDLARAYQETIDTAILSVYQGENTFYDEMYKTVKELSSSGLKTIDYASGRTMRADSAVRMNLKEGIKSLRHETWSIYGEQFQNDGWEVTVHLNPAPDHEDIQGRQFSNRDYEALQNGATVLDYQGFRHKLDHDDNGSFRPIGALNCYHSAFPIVFGVSQPDYTNEQLEEMAKNNKKGFDFEGKHYTMYEGTQLQRRIELEVRKTKDTQIMAREAGITDLVNKSQQKITRLTNKYRELSQASGLPTYIQRMRVPNYKRVAINK